MRRNVLASAYGVRTGNCQLCKEDRVAVTQIARIDICQHCLDVIKEIKDASLRGNTEGDLSGGRRSGS
jgi:hypothetical protein